MAWPLVASGLAATLGAAATGYVLLMPIDGGSQAWIDSPAAGAAVLAGDLVVTAHATDPDRIDALVLQVDGKQVDEDRSPRRTGLLVFGALDWDAAPGTHVLTVRQVGGSSTRSDELVVTVLDPAAPPATPAPTASAPTATPTPTASPTMTASATPTARPTVTPTRAAPSTRPPSPVPAPSTPVPPPPPPPAAPVIASATVSSAWGGKLYTSGCGYQAVVSATTQNATSARADVAGVGSYAMSASGSTWTVTLTGPYSADKAGSHTVNVTATGPGGTVSKAAGTITIINSTCPKD